MEDIFGQKLSAKGNATWDPEAAKAAMPEHVENILTKLGNATRADKKQGEMWYRDAHISAIAVGHGNVERGAGIIAALSPGTNWEANVAGAHHVSRTGTAWSPHTLHEGDVGQTKDNNAKALRILNGEDPLSVLGGPKVRSFYQNIVNPEDPEHVTIDKHAHDIARGIPKGYRRENPVLGLSSAKRYAHFSEAYRTAAGEAGISIPNIVQATTWVTHRFGR